MSEEDRAYREYHDSGLLAVLKWAIRWASVGAWADYDPEKGHSRTVLGVVAHSLLVDRLDRAFRCEKYAVDVPEDDRRDVDVLLAGLTPAEQASMPPVPKEVARANLNGSPSWRFKDHQWFLTSYEFGLVHKISWGSKTRTKQAVAARGGTDHPDQLILPGMVDESFGEDVTYGDLIRADGNTDVLTTVVAHSIDSHSGAPEAFVGRARLNLDGGDPWVWKFRVFGDDGPDGARLQGPAPRPQPRDDVPDAPVRLRPDIAGPGSEAK